ncbi:DUF397 domain-containing protein (plasmid) [Kitasatospora purpeofusca]|uniref:DUF397 domain-containing protein n=1 Tax=Kitasatospora purpeofusca TaxID=67352 RepID=UPI002E15E7A2|nr:DUF397 domain-containing protein [Kitasatospora purpeofusca]
MPTQRPVPGTDHARWHTARASSATGGCVEVADLGDLVAVRDSKDRSLAPHLHPRGAWREFTARLRTQGAVPVTTDRIRVDVAPDGAVTLHDLAHRTPPHSYTAHEWDCFLDGVRNLEPELACA